MKGQSKRVIFFGTIAFLALGFFLTIFGVAFSKSKNETVADVSPAEVVLSAFDFSLKVDESSLLPFSVLPISTDVCFEILDDGIINIDSSGVVIPIVVGEARVKLTAKIDNVSSSKIVTVTVIEEDFSITFEVLKDNSVKTDIAAGEEYILIITANSNFGPAELSFDDNVIAETPLVEGNKISVLFYVTEGSFNVYFTTNGELFTYSLPVSAEEPDRIEYSLERSTLYLIDKNKSIANENGFFSESALSMSGDYLIGISDDTVLGLLDGQIFARGEGKASITFTSRSNPEVFEEIAIEVLAIPLIKVTVELGSELTLSVGDFLPLPAITFTPAYFTGDANIGIKVSGGLILGEGVIRAESLGEGTIKFSVNGELVHEVAVTINADYKIEVSGDVLPVGSGFDGKVLTMVAGLDVILNAVPVLNGNMAPGFVTAAASSDVLEVSHEFSRIVITAKSPGAATVFLYYEHVSAVILVVVE